MAWLHCGCLQGSHGVIHDDIMAAKTAITPRPFFYIAHPSGIFATKYLLCLALLGIMGILAESKSENWERGSSMRLCIVAFGLVAILAGLAHADEVKIRTMTYKGVKILDFTDEVIKFKYMPVGFGGKKPEWKELKKRSIEIQHVQLDSIKELEKVWKFFNKAERFRKHGKEDVARKFYKAALVRLKKRQKFLKRRWLRLSEDGKTIEAKKFYRACKAKWPRLLMRYRLAQLDGDEIHKKFKTKKVSGKSFCPTCRGRGRINCVVCLGVGREKCPDCYGSWYKVCSYCKGTARVTDEKWVTRWTRDGRVGRWKKYKKECSECDEVVNYRGRKIGIRWKCDTCGMNRYPGYVPCQVCDGRKTEICHDCSGTGKAPLPVKSPAKPEKGNQAQGSQQKQSKSTSPQTGGAGHVPQPQ